MSIEEAPTQSESIRGALIFLGAWLGLGLAGLAAMGVFRRGSVAGPLRLRPLSRSSALALVTGCGVIVWLASQAAMLQPYANSPEGLSVEDLPAGAIALLGIVPAVIAATVLLIGDRLLSADIPQRLGYAVGHIPKGVIAGATAFFVAMPAILLASIGLDQAYRLFRFDHPDAHEFLEVLGKSPQGWSAVGIIVAAVIAAPLFEELLFRGHIQSLLVRVFDRRRDAAMSETTAPDVDAMLRSMGDGTDRLAGGSASQSDAMSVRGSSAVGDLSVGDAAWASGSTSVSGLTSGDVAMTSGGAGARWAAILITSATFSMVHAGWTVPIIFLLSVVLGYVYERTGNLWSAITLHMLFNGMQMGLFLLAMSGQP